jgi:hypothetical protein
MMDMMRLIDKNPVTLVNPVMNKADWIHKMNMMRLKNRNPVALVNPAMN